MNHKKFIQLLNLYIDGEATPVEAREVERAIEADPARRRIYNEYCRIQAATRVVYDQFRTAAENSRPETALASRVRAAGLRSAAARPGRAPGHPFRRVLFWSTGAAAACMALALAFWSMPHVGGPQDQVQTAEPPGVSVPTVEAPMQVAADPAVPPASPSYAAPLVAQMRTDPYLLQNTTTPADPFALGSTSRLVGFDDAAPVLGSVPSFAPVSTTLPASGSQIDPARVAEQNRKLQAILRGEIARENSGQQQGPFVPVNFRQQP